MPEWSVTLSEEADRLVRGFLARSGMREADVSMFVDAAVQAEIMTRVTAELRERDPKLSDDGAAELARNVIAIDVGVEDAAAGRGQSAREALREVAAELDLELDR
ncbi:MAG: hypothetical protein GY711_23435 [bacterium]|nr:hypothetical protein [bacterium]